MMRNEHLAILLVPPCLARLLSVASYLFGISTTHIVTAAVISMRLSALAFFAL